MELIPLKFKHSDPGNCRVYFSSLTNLYCWQDEGQPVGFPNKPNFNFLVCTKEGEPSHRVLSNRFSHPFSSLSNEGIEGELKTFLLTLYPNLT